MKPSPTRLFKCAGCDTMMPMFPSQQGRRRCPTCLFALRSDIGRRNRERKRPAVGARKTRAYSGTTYAFLYQPEHPDAPGDGWMLEHRLVMESVIGRRLLPVEVVHHMDHNGLNNDPGNLSLEESRGSHLARHHSAEGVAVRMAGYPVCACGARTAYGEQTCWKCWSKSQTCPTCHRSGRKMARRDMCHGCYKGLRVREGRIK